MSKSKFFLDLKCVISESASFKKTIKTFCDLQLLFNTNIFYIKVKKQMVRKN